MLNLSQVRAMLDAMRDVPDEVRDIAEALFGNPVAIGVGVLISLVVLYPLTFLINVVIIHLGCLIFGAAKNGFNATARVVAYASAPAVVGWVPCIGTLAALYVIVLEVWGISRVQETSVARAVGGVLFILVLFICLCAGCITFGMASAFSRAAG
jgi:hypothetical protein